MDFCLLRGFDVENNTIEDRKVLIGISIGSMNSSLYITINLGRIWAHQIR